MSTAARKERKRTGIPLVRVPKEGTPVIDRIENQPRLIKSGWNTRLGLPSKAKARFNARGIEADS